MQVAEQRMSIGIPVRCIRCKHEWFYRQRSATRDVLCCPKCKKDMPFPNVREILKKYEGALAMDYNRVKASVAKQIMPGINNPEFYKIVYMPVTNVSGIYLIEPKDFNVMGLHDGKEN